jgi:ketosteroid isomerase-like protein
MVSQKVSAEQVRSKVHRYWDALANKSKEKLTDFYTPDALVFMADTRRNEPARLMIERRTREFFDSEGSAGADVIGNIEVQITGPNVAIATYSYHFRAIRNRNNMRLQIDMPQARASQIFRLDADGEVRIVHEHLSAAKLPIITKLDS